MSINKKLKLLINWINESNFKIIADIGTDHGKLLIELNKQNNEKTFFGIDVIKSIIENLKKNHNYEKIKWIHGFGLNPLQDQKLDVVVIAGLGVMKILKILKLDSNLQENIILQTNSNLNEIRNWVNEKKYFIKKENIFENKGNFYHSIFITKYNSNNKILNDDEIFFGPILLKEKTKDFLKYWTKTLNNIKENVNKITDKDRKNNYLKKIERIERILK